MDSAAEAGLYIIELDGHSIRALFYATFQAKHALEDDGLAGEALARMQGRYGALAEAYALTVGAEPSQSQAQFDRVWWENEHQVREMLERAELARTLRERQQAAPSN